VKNKEVVLFLIKQEVKERNRMVSNQQYQIVHGASKMDLMMSLFTPHYAVEPFRVSFRVKEDVTRSEYEDVVVGIQSLEREDGSGETWNFTGYSTGKDGKRVKGFFRTDKRTGCIIAE
jgi:hypothetical protein